MSNKRAATGHGFRIPGGVAGGNGELANREEFEGSSKPDPVEWASSQQMAERAVVAAKKRPPPGQQTSPLRVPPKRPAPPATPSGASVQEGALGRDTAAPGAGSIGAYGIGRMFTFNSPGQSHADQVRPREVSQPNGGQQKQSQGDSNVEASSGLGVLQELTQEEQQLARQFFETLPDNQQQDLRKLQPKQQMARLKELFADEKKRSEQQQFEQQRQEREQLEREQLKQLQTQQLLQLLQQLPQEHRAIIEQLIQQLSQEEQLNLLQLQHQHQARYLEKLYTDAKQQSEQSQNQLNESVSRQNSFQHLQGPGGDMNNQNMHRPTEHPSMAGSGLNAPSSQNSSSFGRNQSSEDHDMEESALQLAEQASVIVPNMNATPPIFTPPSFDAASSHRPNFFAQFKAVAEANTAQSPFPMEPSASNTSSLGKLKTLQAFSSSDFGREKPYNDVPSNAVAASTTLNGMSEELQIKGKAANIPQQPPFTPSQHSAAATTNSTINEVVALTEDRKFVYESQRDLQALNRGFMHAMAVQEPTRNNEDMMHAYISAIAKLKNGFDNFEKKRKGREVDEASEPLKSTRLHVDSTSTPESRAISSTALGKRNQSDETSETSKYARLDVDSTSTPGSQATSTTADLFQDIVSENKTPSTPAMSSESSQPKTPAPKTPAQEPVFNIFSASSTGEAATTEPPNPNAGKSLFDRISPRNNAATEAKNFTFSYNPEIPTSSENAPLGDHTRKDENSINFPTARAEHTNPQSLPKPPQPLFAGATSQPLHTNPQSLQKPPQPLFAGATSQLLSNPSGSLFAGTTSKPLQNPPLSLFASATPQPLESPPHSLFPGAASQRQQFVFGGATPQPLPQPLPNPPGSLFAGTTFQPLQTPPGSPFSSTTSQSLQNPPQPLFPGTSSQRPQSLFPGAPSQREQSPFAGATPQPLQNPPQPLFPGASSQHQQSLFPGATSQRQQSPFAGATSQPLQNQLRPVFAGASSQTQQSFFPGASTVSLSTSRAASPGTSDGGAPSEVDSIPPSNSADGADDATPLRQVDLTAVEPGFEVLWETEKARGLIQDVDTQSWQSQGTGPLRILREVGTDGITVLFRRAPSGSVIFNTRLFEELTYATVGKHAVSFTVVGADGRMKRWFVRFKDQDEADTFAELCEELKIPNSESSDASASSSEEP